MVRAHRDTGSRPSRFDASPVRLGARPGQTRLPATSSAIRG
jgi:hypothetical protein